MRRIFACLLFLAAVPAFAGTACEPARVSPQAFTNALTLATKLRDTLDEAQPAVALVARAGADLSKYGLTYSHMAFVNRNSDGRWRVLHALNHCGSDSSALFSQGLLEFFTDSPFEYKAQIVIPTVATQAALLPLVTDGRARRMHHALYNMIAYPYSTRYQNSNQWVLEVVAVALSAGTVDRTAAHRVLQRTGYSPQQVRIGALERLGASMFKANIRFVDHPLAVRLTGIYPVVSVRSIIRYLQRSGAVSHERQVSIH